MQVELLIAECEVCAIVLDNWGTALFAAGNLPVSVYRRYSKYAQELLNSPSSRGSPPTAPAPAPGPTLLVSLLNPQSCQWPQSAPPADRLPPPEALMRGLASEEATDCCGAPDDAAGDPAGPRKRPKGPHDTILPSFPAAFSHLPGMAGSACLGRRADEPDTKRTTERASLVSRHNARCNCQSDIQKRYSSLALGLDVVQRTAEAELAATTELCTSLFIQRVGYLLRSVQEYAACDLVRGLRVSLQTPCGLHYTTRDDPAQQQAMTWQKLRCREQAMRNALNALVLSSSGSSGFECVIVFWHDKQVIVLTTERGPISGPAPAMPLRSAPGIPSDSHAPRPDGWLSVSSASLWSGTSTLPDLLFSRKEAEYSRTPYLPDGHEPEV
jgi:hypothetical protein